MAILDVTRPNFTPGMPGYGQKLHDALVERIKALHNPNFQTNPIYLDGTLKSGKISAGASLPDISYGPPGRPVIVWDIKTGSAADTGSAANVKQKEQALKNLPSQPFYNYILVYGR